MEGMRVLLRGTLGRSLKAMRPEDRLAAAWPVACGSAMAAHGEVMSYEDGVVRITVSDKEWMQQMRSMSSILERELGKIAGVKVREIHFEVKRF
jgi:hypothetical protein